MTVNPIEPGVVNICAALNELPHVDTFSSCEGHENPKLPQAPLGEFYVNFDIHETGMGWASLNIIVWAASQFFGLDEAGDPAPVFDVHPWFNGMPDALVNEGPISWELRGDVLAADALAETIRGANEAQ